MLVADASVLAPAVGDAGADGQAFRGRLRGQMLCGPDLSRLEVISVLRQQAARGLLTVAQADAAIEDLLALPLRVFPTTPFLGRVWELRDSVNPYDASYVALAEALACPLLTVDARLARAHGPRCAIEVLPTR